MPALQVRDFPEDLYQELKESAESDFRSISQQTVAIISWYLREYKEKKEELGHGETGASAVYGADVKSEGAEERRRRRKRVLEELRAMGPCQLPECRMSAVELLREDRDERERRAELISARVSANRFFDGLSEAAFTQDGEESR